MQQLTHLKLWGGTEMLECHWELVKPLPALVELRLEVCSSCQGSLASMAPWLEHLTALTSLHVEGSKVEEGNDMLYLPPQLEELHLNGVYSMEQLPSGISRLSALTALDVSMSFDLSQLPGWLSQLQQLERLNLDGIMLQRRDELCDHYIRLGQVEHLDHYSILSEEEQEVLRQLPLLRHIVLPDGHVC
jgi:hypothetical protein